MLLFVEHKQATWTRELSPKSFRSLIKTIFLASKIISFRVTQTMRPGIMKISSSFADHPSTPLITVDLPNIKAASLCLTQIFLLLRSHPVWFLLQAQKAAQLFLLPARLMVAYLLVQIILPINHDRNIS